MSGRRVLIVSPHMPPANGADSHRARTLCPFFRENGWSAEVLAVNPHQLAVPVDLWLKAGIPPEVPIHYCDIWSRRWSGFPGLGTLDLRASGPMKRAGNRLLTERQFDLVYFSTTVFSLFTLGPIWKHRWGVPYVVDYQDPWITDYYRKHPEVTPPGGRLKYGLAEYLAKRWEPHVIRHCSGTTSVSDSYVQQLNERYRFGSTIPHLTIPFPGSLRDLERVKGEQVTQCCFDSNDGLMHWVCVGVAGPIMALTLEAFFRALARERSVNPDGIRSLRIHFIGTSYAPPGKGIPFVYPLAKRFGVEDLVEEQTDRIPYSEALACLRDADALLAFGSNDETYNASKLMPYLLAKKPFLCVFHHDSPATQLLRVVNGNTLVTFDSNDVTEDVSREVYTKWLRQGLRPSVIPLNESAIQPHTDRGQCETLCRFFDSVLSHCEPQAACRHV